MSARKSVKLLAVVCITANALVLLPGTYLSFLAWFTKFSGNSPVETTIARMSGISPILGLILSIAVLVSARYAKENSKLIDLKLQLLLSAACTTPLLVYTALKLV